MQRTLLKSEIRRAVLTATELEYEGSITLPADLVEAADLAPHERVQVLNLSTGDRLEAYVIEGEPGAHEPTAVQVDDRNRPVAPRLASES